MKHVHRNIKQLMDLLDKSKDDKRALGKRVGQVLANTYYTDKIPKTGEFIGRLDYKAWGVGSSLRLFITLVNGHRVTCSVFRSNTQVRWYGPRDDSYDFSQTGIEGRFFDLHLVLSKKGFINIRSASESSETFDNLPPPPARGEWKVLGRGVFSSFTWSRAMSNNPMCRVKHCSKQTPLQ